MRLVLCLLAVAALLAGCAAPGKVYSPQEDFGLLSFS
jgi:uncharacterized protein YceK